MFNKTQKYLILGLGIITLVTLCLSFIYKKPPTPPAITKLVPTNGSVKIPLDQNIKITFASPIDINLLSIESQPEEEWIKSPIDSKNILFTHKYALYPNTLYTLKIIYSKQEIDKLLFTTISSQSDPRLVQTIEEEVRRDYPLAVKTPYDAPGFTVVYSKPLTLEITLKEGVEERSEIINAVRDWVKENGLDPDSHTYTFSN